MTTATRISLADPTLLRDRLLIDGRWTDGSKT